MDAAPLSLAPRRSLDLRVLGARALPTRALVRLVAGSRAADDDVRDAASALHLSPAARDAALLRSPIGPRLLAAVELGRRAALSTSPAAARICGPSDVVAAAAVRVERDCAAVVALDVRLRVARLATLDERDDLSALQLTLAAACRRFVVVRRVDGPAAPSADDADAFVALRARAALVGVAAIDLVVVGDDGFASLLRLGALPPREPRYR